MAEESEKTNTVRFVFEKGRHHRTFHADGAWASTTPRGEIQISFFNDLRPVPEFTVHDVSEAGELGKEVTRKVEDNVIARELNVTVVLNTQTTQGLVELLTRLKVQLELENTEQQASEPQSILQAPEPADLSRSTT